MSDTNETQPTNTDQQQTPQNPATPPEQTGAAQDTGLSQADVDRMISERLKRDRAAQESKLTERFGVESLDEVEKALKAHREREQAEMSELEKAQAAIEAANKKAQEALEAKAQLEKQILNDRRKSAFVKFAQDGGGSQVEDLFILVQAKKGSDFESVFGDDATPDEGKMKAFIKDVQSTFPAYFGSAGAGSPSNSSGVAPSNADFTEEAMEAWRNTIRS